VTSLASCLRARTHTPVMTGRRARLILDIEVDGGSPRGQLSTEGRPPREFSGWLQLGEAVEAALAAARDSSGTDGPAASTAPPAGHREWRFEVLLELDTSAEPSRETARLTVVLS